MRVIAIDEGTPKVDHATHRSKLVRGRLQTAVRASEGTLLSAGSERTAPGQPWSFGQRTTSVAWTIP